MRCHMDMPTRVCGKSTHFVGALDSVILLYEKKSTPFSYTHFKR